MVIRLEKKEFLLNTLIFSTVVLELLMMICEIPRGVSYLILISILQYIAYAINVNSFFDIKCLTWLSITIVFAYLSHIFANNTNILGVWNNAVWMSCTLLMLKVKISPRYAKIIFWSVTAYFCIFLLKGVDSSNVLFGVSRNYISVMYIYLNCFIVFSCIDNAKEYKIIYAIIPVIFSVWGYGRGGILSTLIFLMGYIIIMANMEKDVRKRKKYKWLMFACIVLFVFVFFQESSIGQLIFSRFINMGFHDEARNLIWGNYLFLTKKNISTLLFGAEVKQNDYLWRFRGNLHNSIFTMHSRFGIIYVLLSLILFIVGGVKELKNKNWIYLVLLISFFIRGMTDLLFGGYWGDILWWYFLLYPFSDKKKM